jgi:hypothetical protein
MSLCVSVITSATLKLSTAMSRFALPFFGMRPFTKIRPFCRLRSSSVSTVYTLPAPSGIPEGCVLAQTVSVELQAKIVELELITILVQDVIGIRSVRGPRCPDG